MDLTGKASLSPTDERKSPGLRGGSSPFAFFHRLKSGRSMSSSSSASGGSATDAPPLLSPALASTSTTPKGRKDLPRSITLPSTIYSETSTLSPGLRALDDEKVLYSSTGKMKEAEVRPAPQSLQVSGTWRLLNVLRCPKHWCSSHNCNGPRGPERWSLWPDNGQRERTHQTACHPQKRSPSTHRMESTAALVSHHSTSFCRIETDASLEHCVRTPTLRSKFANGDHGTRTRCWRKSTCPMISLWGPCRP
jgi:hypothetical protein